MADNLIVKRDDTGPYRAVWRSDKGHRCSVHIHEETKNLIFQRNNCKKWVIVPREIVGELLDVLDEMEEAWLEERRDDR